MSAYSVRAQCVARHARGAAARVREKKELCGRCAWQCKRCVRSRCAACSAGARARRCKTRGARGSACVGGEKKESAGGQVRRKRNATVRRAMRAGAVC